MVAGGVGVPQLEIRDHGDLIEERRERARAIGDSSVIRPSAVGVHGRAFIAHRDVDEAQRRAGCAAVFATRTAPAPSRPAAAAPRLRPCPRRKVRRGNDIFVINMSLSS